MKAALLSLLLAGAGGLEAEHAELEKRLAAEKAAFDAIGDEKKDLLVLLDTLERMARESSARAKELERTVARVARQITAAEDEAAVAQDALRAQQQKLKPRLVLLYRLQKQDSLGNQLAVGDFATVLKRQRGVQALVAADAQALDELAQLFDWLDRRKRRLELLEGANRRYLRALRTEQAVSAARLFRFRELLTSINAEQNRMSRVIAELEQTEHELADMVGEMQSTGATGFRARRGQLPFPVRGVVEVGFGRVVNPRFNTVTVQKGIDIRAAEGAEVRAVGEGVVVYSAWLKGYGNLVIVDHGANYHSLYAHLANAKVNAGDEVDESGVIGQVGDTGSLKGSYLYFEIRRAGQAVDPLPWLVPQP